jgi:hypothetical protein
VVDGFGALVVANLTKAVSDERSGEINGRPYGRVGDLVDKKAVACKELLPLR